MAILEEGARTGTREVAIEAGSYGIQCLGQGNVDGRTQASSKMTGVCAKEYEGGGCGTSETAHVAYGMAGDIEKIERAITEVIVGLEFANLKRGRKFDLMKVMVSGFDIS
jgi:hypothetical protein